jgi:DNA-binding NarL/FixJ family response regulator
MPLPCWENVPMPSDMPGRWYALPAPERDRMILQLRRQGWTLKRIGKRVGMSESGVKRSLDRIRAGGFGEGMTRD